MLVGREWLTKDIMSLEVEVPQPLDAKPGQFILVELKDHPQRAYSIVEEKESRIRLGIKVQQETSKALSTLALESSIEILGPFGTFTPRQGKNIVLVAGGIGITPIVSLYQYYKNQHSKVEVIISTNNEFVFLEYFDAPILVDTTVQSRVTADDISADSLVFICGPQPMVESLRESLIARGHNPDDIFSEDFS